MDGPADEGPEEEALSEEDEAGGALEGGGGMKVEEAREEEDCVGNGVGEEMFLGRGCLKVTGAGGAVEEDGGEGGKKEDLVGSRV
ncbi:hypothetical protein Taro_017645 [Colocasia esculenta]|uniref:Uncharacterized protein n=1 Tax=Colocasia esculenta TaxID=4460 RepID=A0A843UNN2_COLES|nr:hypothetical protein [Colocasia esculenta]